VRDARYELRRPLRGEIDVGADRVPGSESWFGAVRRVDASVVPLQKVALETRREAGSAETVRSGGEALATERDVLEENRLPPGRYLMVVTLWGEDNWDRQVLYFEVAAD
jgi:hypothetical protein